MQRNLWINEFEGWLKIDTVIKSDVELYMGWVQKLKLANFPLRQKVLWRDICLYSDLKYNIEKNHQVVR